MDKFTTLREIVKEIEERKLYEPKQERNYYHSINPLTKIMQMETFFFGEIALPEIEKVRCGYEEFDKDSAIVIKAFTNVTYLNFLKEDSYLFDRLAPAFDNFIDVADNFYRKATLIKLLAEQKGVYDGEVKKYVETIYNARKCLQKAISEAGSKINKGVYRKCEIIKDLIVELSYKNRRSDCLALRRLAGTFSKETNERKREILKDIEAILCKEADFINGKIVYRQKKEKIKKTKQSKPKEETKPTPQQEKKVEVLANVVKVIEGKGESIQTAKTKTLLDIIEKIKKGGNLDTQTGIVREQIRLRTSTGVLLNKTKENELIKNGVFYEKQGKSGLFNGQYIPTHYGTTIDNRGLITLENLTDDENHFLQNIQREFKEGRLKELVKKAIDSYNALTGYNINGIDVIPDWKFPKAFSLPLQTNVVRDILYFLQIYDFIDKVREKAGELKEIYDLSFAFFKNGRKDYLQVVNFYRRLKKEYQPYFEVAYDRYLHHLRVDNKNVILDRNGFRYKDGMVADRLNKRIVSLDELLRPLAEIKRNYNITTSSSEHKTIFFQYLQDVFSEVSTTSNDIFGNSLNKQTLEEVEGYRKKTRIEREEEYLAWLEEEEKKHQAKVGATQEPVADIQEISPEQQAEDEKYYAEQDKRQEELLEQEKKDNEERERKVKEEKEQHKKDLEKFYKWKEMYGLDKLAYYWGISKDPETRRIFREGFNEEREREEKRQREEQLKAQREAEEYHKKILEEEARRGQEYYDYLTNKRARKTYDDIKENLHNIRDNQKRKRRDNMGGAGTPPPNDNNFTTATTPPDNNNNSKINEIVKTESSIEKNNTNVFSYLFDIFKIANHTISLFGKVYYYRKDRWKENFKELIKSALSPYSSASARAQEIIRHQKERNFMSLTARDIGASKMWMFGGSSYYTDKQNLNKLKAYTKRHHFSKSAELALAEAVDLGEAYKANDTSEEEGILGAVKNLGKPWQATAGFLAKTGIIDNTGEPNYADYDEEARARKATINNLYNVENNKTTNYIIKVKADSELFKNKYEEVEVRRYG